MVDIANNAVAGITGYTDELYGFEADSSPIDTTMGVLIMADENQNGLIAVNLNDAVCDDTTDTFTATPSVIAIEDVGSRLPGIAAETTNHFLFGEEEFGAGLGVAALPSTAATGAIAITDYNWASAPDPSATCPDFDTCFYKSIIFYKNKCQSQDLVNGTGDKFTYKPQTYL